MSLLGFDAIGRLAIGQNTIAGVLPAVYGGSFGIWPPAVAPKNFARDWVAFSGNVYVETLPISSVFSQFYPPAAPRNFAKDWIAFSGDYYVETQTLSFFTGFSVPPPPPHLAKDWIVHSDIGFTVVPVNQIAIDFLPFAPGLSAKLWSDQGPQWWAYYFSAPFFPSGRDTHDGGHLRHWHHRHPSVYSQEYYDQLRRKEQREDDEEAIELPPVKARNLLIPLNRLIPPLAVPSLLQAPPYRPMPSLTTSPPPFQMATPEQIAADDEMIIRMLLEE